MTDEMRARASFRGTGDMCVSANIRTTASICELFISASRLFFSFNIQDGECFGDRNEERGGWLHFNPSYVSAFHEDAHPSFVQPRSEG